MHTVYVSNVNDALPRVMQLFASPDHRVSVTNERTGSRVFELRYPLLTCYVQPRQRVLFSTERRANPFFHLFEALWILAGRRDVSSLAYWLPRIAGYSDDGEEFHGAYGARMQAYQQLDAAVEELRRDPTSRRAVVAVWQPVMDSGYQGKDMPCNTTVYFRMCLGALDITVCNRSNDMLWGGYGTNVVQFSFLQEYVACALGVPVGMYYHFSNNAHVYVDTDVYQRCANLRPSGSEDLYRNTREAKTTLCGGDEVLLTPVRAATPLFAAGQEEAFKKELHLLWQYLEPCSLDGLWRRRSVFKLPFFRDVVAPMAEAFFHVKEKKQNDYDVENAMLALHETMEACDWRAAALQWLARKVGR